jgi:hypothetical protein
MRAGPKHGGLLLGHDMNEFIINIPFTARVEPDLGPLFHFFSICIVLLELGLWVPISNLRKDHVEDQKIVSAEHFRKKLLGSYVPQLGEKIGALYRNSVAVCLGAEEVIGLALKEAEKHAETERHKTT